MRIKLLRQVFTYKVGTILSPTIDMARYLIASNQAVSMPDETSTEPVIEPVASKSESKRRAGRPKGAKNKRKRQKNYANKGVFSSTNK